MTEPEIITSELTVIGSGIAGMAAALFAAARGISTLQVGANAGEIMFASGLLDLLGVHPVQEKRVWLNPWEGIDHLVGDLPGHPYSRIKKEDIRTAFHEFVDFLREGDIPYQGRPDVNVEMVTPMGTVKVTYRVPETMWPGVMALQRKHPCLLIDFHGLKEFSAALIASNLRNKWPELRTQRISFPGASLPGELYTPFMAEALEAPEGRLRLAKAVQPHVKDARAVGMPAVLGMRRSSEIVAELEQQIGVPIFEIPTLPTSVPGLRLKECLEKLLQLKGVRQFPFKRVLKARYLAGDGFELSIGNTEPQFSVYSKGVILASGRFLGQGLRAQRNGIRETIFDLPVHQPEHRAAWHSSDFFDPGGHPVNQAGLNIDNLFRPLGAHGRPAYHMLFVAGSILAHQDWMRMKCGSGLAIATAYAAVNSFLKLNEKNIST